MMVFVNVHKATEDGLKAEQKLGKELFCWY